MLADEARHVANLIAPADERRPFRREVTETAIARPGRRARSCGAPARVLELQAAGRVQVEGLRDQSDRFAMRACMDALFVCADAEVLTPAASARAACDNPASIRNCLSSAPKAIRQVCRCEEPRLFVARRKRRDQML